MKYKNKLRRLKKLIRKCKCDGDKYHFCDICKKRIIKIEAIIRENYPVEKE